MPTPNAFLEGSPELPSDRTLARQKHSSLASISVPSFSAFRAQASSIPVASPVRRKPLPQTASPRVSANSSFAHLASPRSHDAGLAYRPYSLGSSPPAREANGSYNVLSPPLTAEFTGQDLEQSVRNRFRRHKSHNASGILTSGDRLLNGHMPHDRDYSIDSRLSGQELDAQRRTVPSSSPRSSIPLPLNHDKDVNVQTGRKSSLTRLASDATSPPRRMSRTMTSTTMKPLPQAPEMALHQDGLPRSISDMSLGSTQSGTSPTKRRNPSPTNKFTSFFGWKAAARPYSIESPATVFSDHDSPSTSPTFTRIPQVDGSASISKLTPSALDVDRANHASGTQYYDGPITPFTLPTSSNSAHVEELERELREVSSELAGSIRREMELEDEIERCRDQSSNSLSELTRRTSDYFSDSGASSVRFPLGDGEVKLDELEKAKRKLEQEKGQIRADYSQKLSEELKQRRLLEERVQKLEQDLEEGKAKVSEGQEKDERVRELEVYLKDSQRRLSQERKSKDNFEDLLTALRGELEDHRNDRDNLRDEVVPQLKARIDGLEIEAAEASKLRYENARMQQEIQELKGESADAPGTPSNGRFGPIAERDATPAKGWMGLGRSNSVARTPSTKRGTSLSRSASVKDHQNSARHPGDHDHVKDVEDQRDALHQTLQNLLRRHDAQKREHTKAIRKLITDRDRAKNLVPARSHFARDVTNLHEEVAVLRRRADEALEQKMQYENNLSGVKMALDRAEQETRSLRKLLGSNSPKTPVRSPSSSISSGLGIQLDEEVEVEDAESMIKVLRRSITMAETERDAALREAEAYRVRARSLQESEVEHFDREQEMARELLQSAARMEELAAQVQSHLSSNMALRERLTKAVGNGEREQSTSTQKVVQMQSRLRAMEESVLAAQQQSECTLTTHEEEAKRMEDSAASPQLHRLRITVPAPGSRSPQPLFSAGKSPRLGTGAGNGGRAETLMEASKTRELEEKVAELESALREADSEMQGVVQRIEKSTFEIAELQSER